MRLLLRLLVFAVTVLAAVSPAFAQGAQINAGGPAVSPFVADQDFAGGTTINHANTINLSGVTNPAPMAVYQTARIGNFTYTIPGFAAGSSNPVRLHFAETFFTTAGSRTFNVSINGTQVLTNFDVFATAGATNKAVIEQFTEAANSSGQYVITFTSVVNNALVSGIEAGSSSTPPPPSLLAINSGGPAVSPFVADEDFAGGATINHANTIDLSGVTNPAPMAVYQTARVTATVGAGTSFTYTIPGFTAGSSQLVRLHFAETFHTTAGSRVFNVSINGTQALTNFDIFAAAGAANKAVIKEFTVAANASGQYVIVFTTVTDKALISGIEVSSGNPPPPQPPAAPTNLTATAVSSSQINLSWTASTTSGVTYTVIRNGSTVKTGITGTTDSDTGLAPSTTYSYTVEAVNSAGTSGPSNQASATTQPQGCTTNCPPPPSGFVFSPYKDVTINANWNTGGQQSAVTGTVQPITSAMPNQSLTWAFASGTCGSETWGGLTPAMEATNVQSFVNAGKFYIVSTGGAGGSFTCPSSSGFISFIQRYNSANMLGVDFDIESGQNQLVVDDLINDVKAAEAQFPNMRFSFTIATLGGSSNPDLGSEGNLVVNEIKRLGLGGNYMIDLMVMDYGSATPTNCVVVNGVCEMGQSAIQAAMALHSQYGIPYNHIELTPMIGQNDSGGEIFTLGDVDTVSSWVKSNGLAGVHFWSFDRDTPCAAGSASATCNSYPTAGVLAFNHRFTADLGVK